MWRELAALRVPEPMVDGVYDSVWWRMTAPLRWLADRVRRREWLSR